jgi:hypothetical protein
MEEKNDKTVNEVIRVRVQPQIHEPAHTICPARTRYALFDLIPQKTLQIRSNWRGCRRNLERFWGSFGESRCSFRWERERWKVLWWRETREFDPFSVTLACWFDSPIARGSNFIVCFVVGYFCGMYTSGEVAFDGSMEISHQFGCLFSLWIWQFFIYIIFIIIILLIIRLMKSKF